MKAFSPLSFFSCLLTVSLILSCQEPADPVCNEVVYDDNKGTRVLLPDYPYFTDQSNTFHAESDTYILIGSFYYSGAVTRMSVYNKITGNWSNVSDFISTDRIYPAVFAINDQFYFAGGKSVSSNYYFNQSFKYDPSNDTWILVNNFGNSSRGYAYGESINGKGYMLGGTNSFNGLNTVLEYDPANNVWVVYDTLVSTIYNNYCYASCTIDNRIYIYSFTHILVYDPSTKTDYTLPVPLQDGEIDLNMIYTDGESLYFPASNDPAGYSCVNYDKIYKLDPSTQVWKVHKKYTGDDYLTDQMRAFNLAGEIYFADIPTRKFSKFIP